MLVKTPLAFRQISQRFGGLTSDTLIRVTPIIELIRNLLEIREKFSMYRESPSQRYKMHLNRRDAGKYRCK